MAILWVLLGVISGACIAVQAPINAQLGRDLGLPFAAAFVSFAAGAILLGIVTFTVASATQTNIHWSQPVWWLFIAGGALGTVYVTSAVVLTPQIGADDEEILSPQIKENVLTELAELKKDFPKLDLPKLVIEGYRKPPKSPDECIFSKTTLNITADLKNRITPCQFGGTPDCSQCGCIASAGLAAIGDYRLFGFVPLRSIYNLSDRVGKTIGRVTN